jgi:hypothetical protein
MEFVNNIRVGLENEHRMCYLTSVIQIFYHIRDVRKLVVKIPDREDSASQLGKLFIFVERGQRRCIYQFTYIQTVLGMELNGEAFEATQELLDLFMRSQYARVREVIRQSPFFKVFLAEEGIPRMSQMKVVITFFLS